MIMSLKKDIEPLIIEANEIANNLGKKVKFELHFIGSVQEE